MRRYSPHQYRGINKKRYVGRIVLLALLAAAILITVLILGNILHDRLEQAAPLLALPIVSYAEESTASPTAYIPFQAKNVAKGIYCAPDIQSLLRGQPKEQDSALAAAAELYDGISVTAADDTGLRFALTEGESGDLPKLRTLNTAADTHELTMCAVLVLPDNIPALDSEICISAQTLAASGFDEILFTGLSAASLNGRDIGAMTALAASIKEKSPSLRVGYALDAAVFADIDSIPSLESLAAQSDFLAVDLGIPPEGEDAAAFARERHDALYGSITYYPLRVLIRGGTAAAAAQTEALRELGVTAIQPIS